MKRYNSFDCFKGLGCLAVVLIHYNFPGNLGIAVKTLSRFAVPLFFAVSGFFCLDYTLSFNRKSIKRKLKHIFILTFGAVVFYAIFAVFWNLLINSEWNLKEFLIGTFSRGKVVKFFITNDPFIYAHLWFLFALIYCYIFVFVFGRRNPCYMGVLIPFLLMGYTCLAELQNLFGIQRSIIIPGTDKRIMFFNLFIFRALPFFLIGIATRVNEERLYKLKLNKKILLLITIIGLALSVIERWKFGEAQFYIGTYLVLICMLIFAVGYPDFSVGSLNYIGKRLSIYVYIFHIAVGKLLDYATSKMHLWDNIYFLHIRAFIVIGVTLILAAVIDWTINRRGRHPLGQ